MTREIRRARPLLGTFVEISASGGDDHALGCAFDAILVLQKKLSMAARLSAGAFDPTAGSRGASWRDIELLPGSRVQFPATSVVAVMGEDAGPVLARYRARACIVRASMKAAA